MFENLVYDLCVSFDGPLHVLKAESCKLQKLWNILSRCLFKFSLRRWQNFGDKSVHAVIVRVFIHLEKQARENGVVLISLRVNVHKRVQK